MDDETCRELGIMSEKELIDMDERMAKTEDSGLLDLVKYFDRIHDKVFQLNTLILGLYFALIAINPKLSIWLMLVPVVNIFILLLVDYRMMEKSRLQSKITSLVPKDISKYQKLIDSVNIYSLFSITVTGLVTLFLVYLMLTNGVNVNSQT